MPEPGSSDKTECGIEITPEMIEAGLLHLYSWHPDTGVGDEETVKRIFREMLRLSAGRLPAQSLHLQP